MDNLTTPDMRGEIKEDPKSLYLMDHPDSDEEIPTLDISPYLSGAPGGREKVSAELRHISTTVGFFYLKGHEIPDEVFAGIFAQARRLHGCRRTPRPSCRMWIMGRSSRATNPVLRT